MNDIPAYAEQEHFVSDTEKKCSKCKLEFDSIGEFKVDDPLLDNYEVFCSEKCYWDYIPF